MKNFKGFIAGILTTVVVMGMVTTVFGTQIHCQQVKKIKEKIRADETINKREIKI